MGRAQHGEHKCRFFPNALGDLSDFSPVLRSVSVARFNFNPALHILHKLLGVVGGTRTSGAASQRLLRFRTTDAHRTQHTACCTRDRDTLPGEPSTNPWLPSIQTTLQHPDDHLCKLQRALVHFATVYSTRKPGDIAKVAKAGLEGAEVLDGRCS
ncbi:hypothetical protein A0H81_07052 [Grifola frondosa]|uniref:Uncharacterized protein n=1 Tax=Grifola frondosa TaxID=5627 RepID=A0A1C7M8K1_GRIFR|nr:hypothetical protein A0H81_07052 [Grifola frondosa]